MTLWGYCTSRFLHCKASSVCIGRRWLAQFAGIVNTERGVQRTDSKGREGTALRATI